METQIARVRAFYRDKRDLTMRALDRHLRGRATWRTPEGGFFVWITFDPSWDVTAMVRECAARGVRVRSGADFRVDQDPRHSVRLAFSHTEPQAIEQRRGGRWARWWRSSDRFPAHGPPDDADVCRRRHGRRRMFGRGGGKRRRRAGGSRPARPVFARRDAADALHRLDSRRPDAPRRRDSGSRVGTGGGRSGRRRGARSGVRRPRRRPRRRAGPGGRGGVRVREERHPLRSGGALGAAGGRARLHRVLLQQRRRRGRRAGISAAGTWR